MERFYYDDQSLSISLAGFEWCYGMSSEVFYESHKRDDETVEHIPGFHRHVWASYYRDVRRMREAR